MHSVKNNHGCDCKFSLKSNGFTLTLMRINLRANGDFCLSALVRKPPPAAVATHICARLLEEISTKLQTMLMFAKIPKFTIKSERSQSVIFDLFSNSKTK